MPTVLSRTPGATGDTPRRQAPAVGWPPSPRRGEASTGGDDLLEAGKAGPDDRVLVVGGERADILCAALRRGCRSAIGIVTPERHPAPADLVLAPRVATAEQAAAVGECARRAMTDGVQRRGRLAIGLLGAGAAALGRTVARLLRNYGFARARLRAGAQGRLMLICEFSGPAAPDARARKV